MQRGWIISKLLVGFGMSNVRIAVALGYRRVPQSVYCKKWIMWRKIRAVSDREWASAALQLLPSVLADPRFVAWGSVNDRCVLLLVSCSQWECNTPDVSLEELLERSVNFFYFLFSSKVQALSRGTNCSLEVKSQTHCDPGTAVQKKSDYQKDCVAHTQTLNYHHNHRCYYKKKESNKLIWN